MRVIARSCVVSTCTAIAGAALGGDAPSIQFSDVSAIRGIGPYTSAGFQGCGIAAADYDDDGDIDLFVPNGNNVADQLYRNDGTGHFTEVAAAVGLASLKQNRAALWFDCDGDGDLDLFVGGDRRGIPNGCSQTNLLTLFRQDSPTQFTDITVGSGLDIGQINCGTHFGGVAAGDVNGDDLLDLMYVFWDGLAQLYLSDGDGTFTNISIQSGIVALGDFWTPIFHDFNDDGLLDIYQAVDFAPNRLWLNQGNSTFTDVAPAVGADNLMNDMGVTLGDYDNDGDFDLYITNIYQVHQNPPRQCYNVLYRNDSIGANLMFTDVSMDQGVDQGYWGWGTTFLDCDNNGFVDLAATNGYVQAAFINDPSRFFVNQGAGPVWFQERSSQVGFDDTYWGSGLVAFDADRDGDLELVQATVGGPLRLLDNNAAQVAPFNWLTVRPRMAGANRRAIGAVVRVTAGSLNMSRVITAGTSFFSQEPAEAFFGLEFNDTADSVTVEWPDGRTSVLSNVSGNQVIEISPLCPGDADGDEQVTISDLNLVLGNFGTSGPSGDLNGDGAVNVADLNLVLGNFGGTC